MTAQSEIEYQDPCRARLIAAAPDLLAALRLCLDDLKTFQLAYPSLRTATTVLPQAIAAIAAATGDLIE